MKIKGIGLIFFLLSVIVPMIFIPFSNSLRDYMALKLMLLFAGVLLELIKILSKNRKIRFNSVDKAMTVFVVWIFLSSLWGDYSIETSGIQFIYISIFFVSYVIARISALGAKKLENSFFIFLLIELVLHFIFVGPERGAINGAYLVGTASSFFLFTFSKTSYRNIFLSLIITAFLGGRRFVFVQLVGFLKKLNKWVFFASSTIAILIISIITYDYFQTNIVVYQLLLGYRVFEYSMLFSKLSIIELIFGSGLGTESFFYKFTSKGQVKHYGIFHNFYLTIIFNYGLLGFFTILGIIFNTIRKNKGLILLFTISWVFMAAIDSPKDGHWPLGTLLGILNSYDNNNTA